MIKLSMLFRGIMLYFSKLIALGTKHQKLTAIAKIRLVNIISLITMVISAGYSLNYFFVLHQPLVAMINTSFIFGYAITFVFMYFHAAKNAKTWFFSILMLHLFICTNLYVTNASGFHLYYFLVPTGVFLLYEFKDKKEKIVLSILSIILMVYCENTLNTSPLIVLTDAINRMLYQSVIVINMIEVTIVIVILNNQLEKNETKLTQQATTDSLTQIANRHYFFEQGNILIELSNVNQHPFTMILLDLDLFKKINDRYGHGAGDLCLVEITSIIQHLCRKQDLFARIGGEEFAIILPETTAEEAYCIAERMRVMVEQQKIPIVGAQSFTCTASFGISGKTSDSTTLKNLLLQADEALYLAKEQGRNRVQIFQQS
ncbi:MAG: GGDEF domain-containing protein [Colwellia sp.]|nr:GGDEF domain-containing protein [Colwellia sp.]